MTLATRCPACGTAFRVVSDQLRVSSGWVRCGRCGASFDALEHLFRHASARKAADLEASTPIPAPPEESGTAPATAERATAADQPAALLADLATPSSEVLPQRAESEPPLQDPPSLEVPWLEPTPADEPAPVDGPAPAQAPAPAAAPAPEPVPPPVDEPLAEPAAADAAPDEPPAIEPAAPAPVAPGPIPSPPPVPADLGWARQSGYRPRGRPSFLRRAEAAARWTHPATRTTLALLLVVLAAVLAAQAALLWRDEIALRWPATRATLQAACATLHCHIEAPRRIQSLDVLSSELLSEPDGATYRLEVAIRNRGTIEALAPAIELTLTDTGGRLYARRVLTLAELGQGERAIGPGEELLVRAELVTGSASVAGYNIALFYP